MSNNSKSTHVVPNKEKGGWDIKQSGGQRSSGHFDIQREAIDRARQISQNQGTELYVHNRKGQIREKDSHGKDPFPPEG
ncbi:DUF2188 domain-containing protein [Pelobacter seleniigenes]|uniref:DUF2188 domain-containing protein n=1 Tax=Pelobacter seleniigenes TaxID=407188 RepID=UPI0004A75F94|nr:DUF2188 domain-containing protein [Pelobacter seleniigenes]